MGIHQLTKLLQEVAPGCVRERTLAAITSRKLAIDASGALYAYLVAIRSSAGGGAPAAMLTNEAGEVTSHLQGMFNRTIRMLEAGVKPIYVFDGKPPTMKSGELAKRRAAKEKAAADLEDAKEEGNVADMERFAKRTVAMTSDHMDDCKRLLRLMGVPVVEAPCEAEAQCAALAKAGKVFGVGSEDMDTLTFGAPVLVRRLTFSDARKLPLLEFRLDMVLSELGMTMPQFIDLCILCGCDYVDSVRGIGPKTALKLIRAHGTLEAVVEAIKKEGKFTIPDHFDFESARELFVSPEVADVDSLDIGYKEMDEDNLVKFLVEEKGFNPERVARGVEKLKKARKGGTQQRMDSFFTRAAPPAGSASKKKPAAGAGAGAGKGKGKPAPKRGRSGGAAAGAGGSKAARFK